jgi:hypothetical protein
MAMAQKENEPASGGRTMKWVKPKLHDLSDLKKLVGQGACTGGAVHQFTCIDGSIADPTCSDGVGVGDEGQSCSGGSAVT